MKAFFLPTLATTLLLLGTPAFATEIVQKLNLSGSTATQSSELGGYPASNAIDGNYGNFTHTNIPDANATWTLTMPALTPFSNALIYNRGDGCCGYRLQDITFTAYSDAAGTVPVYTSPVLNPGNTLNGPGRLELAMPAGLQARVIRISRAATDPNSHDGSVLSLGEVELVNRANVTLPLGTSLTRANIAAMTLGQSSEYPGFPAINAADGNDGNFTHTGESDTNAMWFVDFNEDMRLQTINLHNRGDGCCGSRMRDITVRVLNDAGSTIFTSGLLNPENAGFAFPGGPGDLFLDLAALNGGVPIIGARVEVSRTADVDLSGTGGQGNSAEGTVLSLGEVTVTGGSIPEPATGAMLMLGLAGFAARRRRA